MSGKSGPTDQEVAEAAFQIWESEGMPHGKDQEHWLRAKAALEAKAPAKAPAKKAAVKKPAAKPTAKAAPKAVAKPVVEAKAEAPAKKPRAPRKPKA